MTSAFARVQNRYEMRAQEEKAIFASSPPQEVLGRLDEFLLHVGREVAEWLLSLAIARDAQCLVELGTSYGYSTLYLAEAARRTGGILHSFEISDVKQAYARSQIEEAGLASQVRWHLGDAVANLAILEERPDLVLIDLWKDLYVPCLDAFYPKLADQALIVADNMLHPVEARAEAARYRNAVGERGDLKSILLPIGSGIELSCLHRGGS